MAKSIVSILYTTDSVELAIKGGAATTGNSRGFITVGVDGGGVARFLLVDTSGRSVVVGAGVAGTPAGGVLSIQGVAGGTALPVSGTFWQATQPISAVSLPLPTGAATETTLASRLAEATFTARINTLGQKAMAASTPVVLSSDQSAIPVTDNGGSLTVDGTVTANQGTGAGAAAPWATRLSDGASFYDGTKTGQLPTALVGGRLDANLGAWLGSTAPTVGQKAMASSLPVTFASDQSTLPVSVASLPLPIGAATEATLATRLAEATFTARINTLGQKVMAASTPVVLSSDQSAVPVTDNGGSLTVDTPQLPAVLVGGRLDVVVGAALPAGTNNIGDVDILSVPAPLSTTGGGTEATALRVTLANDSTGVLSVDDNGGSLTVDTPQLPAALVGSRLDTNVGAWLGATTPTVGQKAMAASIPVVLASDQTTVVVAEQKSSTATHTNVVSSITSVTLLASNAARRGATVYNDSNQDLFVKLGATASATSFMVKIDANGYLEVPFGYTGVIDGIWNVANGFARVVEFT